MKILALDTSTKHFSLAVAGNGKVLASKDVVLDKILSQSIVPAIAEVLKKVKLKIKDVDGFVVGLGPGSFTSLRVGLATVKGLSFSTAKPVVGIVSLDAIALGVKLRQGTVLVIQDARRGLVYAALYEKKGLVINRLGEYQLVALEEVLNNKYLQTHPPLMITGDAVGMYKDKIAAWAKLNNVDVAFDSRKNVAARAKELIVLSQSDFVKKKFKDVASIIPLYLYPADCQVQK